MTIVLVTGSRDHPDPSVVYSALDDVDRVYGISTIVVGDCPSGADAYARSYSSYRGVALTVVEADWRTHGRKAGPIRNREMVDTYKPDVCLAFLWPGQACRGTRQCARYARTRGVETRLFGLTQ